MVCHALLSPPACPWTPFPRPWQLSKRFTGPQRTMRPSFLPWKRRDRFIRHAVGKTGYRPTEEVTAFLICHFSNITRALLRKGQEMC